MAPPSDVRIRPETAADHERVHRVHGAAFGREDEALLVERLRSAARPQLSLVAEYAGAVAGHVFFSPVSLEAPRPGPPAAALAPLGVTPDLQGRGVGDALVREGLARCPALGWRAVFVLGDPAYYARFGFEPAAAHGFRCGYPGSERAFQLLALEPGALADRAGGVRFHAAFGEA